MAKRPALYLCLILAAAFLVAIGLRVYKCFDWPLDGDEIYTLHNSQVIHWGVDPAELSGKIYALCPLSFYLNRPLLEAGARDEFGIRAVPLLSGIAACLVLPWLTLRSYGPRVALIVAVLLALNPYHVEMSQYGRYYAMVFLLASVSWLMLHEAVRDRSLMKLIVALLALLAAIASHLPAAFLLPGEFLYLVLAWPSTREDATSQRFSRWGLFLLLLGGIGLVAYLYPAIGQWKGVQQTGARGPLGLIAGWATAVGLGVAVLNLFGVVHLVTQRDRRVWLPLVAQGLPCLVLLGLAILGKTVMPQFVGYVYFAMFVVCGLVIDSLLGEKEASQLSTHGGKIAGLLLALAVVPALPSLASHYVDGNRHDFPRCIEFMRKNVKQGGIVFSSWPHVVAYHARRSLSVPVITNADFSNDLSFGENLERAIRAETLVVLDSPRMVLFIEPSLPYVEEGSLWAIQKIERGFDQSSIVESNKRIVMSWDTYAKLRLEFSPKRFDHRRNRLDVFQLDEDRVGKNLAD